MSGFFTCPVCGAPLLWGERACRCPAGHCYDLAAEGYVYLLPPNKKHSKAPGDDKGMVAARRAFLESGGYDLFREKLCSLAAGLLNGLPAPVVLDVGCGEGWYTGGLCRALAAAGCQPQVYGVDVSKFAVKAAAKKYREARFAVASAFSLPAAASSVDLAVNVFAPIVPQELERVVRPGGFLLLAVPTPRHLYGMKQLLYEEPYENERRDTDYPGFRLLRRETEEGRLALASPALVQALFTMTPYFWKTPRAGVERLRRAEGLRTEIGFDFLIYRREENA